MTLEIDPPHGLETSPTQHEHRPHQRHTAIGRNHHRRDSDRISARAALRLRAGLLTPDLFRALFGARHEVIPNGGPVISALSHPLDPLQIGIGLGLINGAIMGFIAGLITVIASAWLRVRRNTAESG